MERPRQDVPISTRSREWEGPSRWAEYLGPGRTPTISKTSVNAVHDGQLQSTSGSHKGLNIQWVFQLNEVAEGLMAKMYRLNQILDYPDPVSNIYSESWKSSIFPNHPRICLLLAKKFPEHFSKLQLERVDKAACDALHDSAELHLQSLEPWIQLLLDLMAYQEQALRLILDLSSTVITLLPHQNSLILHAFMDLFCFFVRVNLFSEKLPRKMFLQTYNLLYSMCSNERDCDFYHRLVQFIDSYDPPLKGLQEDLNFVSPRIGEVLEAVGPIIFLSTDTRKLRNEGFLSLYHPRYPDILTNSAHPMRAQDLANVTSYREWVLLGYLVCPDELLRVTSIDIALLVLKENLILTLFRDEYILLHEDYQLYVLPRILESKKMAKSGRTKQKEADLEYSVAKQMVFSALALAQSEVTWYFQNVGIVSSKSKVSRTVPVDIDPSDPTIGFLLDGMDHLCCLVHKYIAEGLLSEGNAAYNWSRCVDELEFQLSKHGSLKKLYFYHQHLTVVFRNTMFGPEGRPQHCCAWLGVASSFPECVSPIVPEEVTKIGRDAVLYVESLIESIMGGLEGLTNILDSEGGFGALESQLLPEQAAFHMNYASRVSIPSAKSPRGPVQLSLPGDESYPENNNSIKMLEAAMQRLTNLCSVLNDMEPICVLNHVFVLREVKYIKSL
ncbi:hypothetical protein SAY86_030963 [Trapa natans]|uniref:Protein NAP1 n=1 Tax=Trapa natans TaxID=22666 RepID=A0AAN7MGT2_TRANT|nr:hypothetical protein SAY86_030963 [Trapa natans]